MIPPDADLHALYQQCVSSSGTHPACEEFFRYLGPVFNRIALRVARQFEAVQDLDDVIQEISLKISSSSGTILGALPRETEATVAYLSVVAANAARDFFRARHAARRGAAQTSSLDERLDWIAGAASGGESMDRGLLISQIENRLPADRREQTVFRLYYRQGFTAGEIAAIPGLNLTVKGVESMIHRLTLHIREQVRQAPQKGTSGAGSF